ncbi:MAG: hypothetical protein V4525_00790 [Pseudomonadota bacterium]
MLEAHASKWHHDYEKNVFVTVAGWVVALCLFMMIWKGLNESLSVLVGFVIIWSSYRFAAHFYAVTENSASTIANLIKVSLIRLTTAIVLMGIILELKQHVESFPVETVYLVLGFIFSVIVYRIRVVLGEVKNV